MESYSQRIQNGLDLRLDCRQAKRLADEFHAEFGMSDAPAHTIIKSSH